MTIKELQRRIEDSLEAVQEADDLPEALQGLRLLLPQDAAPRVTIRRRGRRLYSYASAEDFRPEDCEVILRFDADEGDYGEEQPARRPYEEEDVRPRPEISELLDALERAEQSRDFVGLKWFRDRFLPTEGYAWAQDRGLSGRLIREATIKSLVLTSQISNPRDPMQPTTAIRINRNHPWFQEASAEPRQPAAPKPFAVRGRPLAGTGREDGR